MITKGTLDRPAVSKFTKNKYRTCKIFLSVETYANECAGRLANNNREYSTAVYLVFCRQLAHAQPPSRRRAARYLWLIHKLRLVF